MILEGNGGGGAGQGVKEEPMHKYIYHYRVTENSPVLLYKKYLPGILYPDTVGLGQER